MFGFVTANYDGLSAEAQSRYKSYYCGLCRCIGCEYGVFSRMTLTYDMTFMALVLSSLSCTEDEEGEGRCFIHPLSTRPYIINENTRYSADMNIILAYYSLLDKWNDDKNLLSAAEAGMLKTALKKAGQRQFGMLETVKRRLEELSAVEKASVTNPDVPADIFGTLLGEIFSKGNAEYKEIYGFGRALGRFVYIADAVKDLKSDIKREQYNPLVTTPRENFQDILSLLMAECTEKYALLKEKYGCKDPLELEIIENILYSGVWTVFETERKETADR